MSQSGLGTDIDDILTHELQQTEIMDMNKRHLWSMYRLDIRLAVLEECEPDRPLLCHSSIQLPSCYSYDLLCLDEATHAQNIISRLPEHQRVSKLNLADALGKGARVIQGNQALAAAVRDYQCGDMTRKAESMSHMYLGNGIGIVTRTPSSGLGLNYGSKVQFGCKPEDIAAGMKYFCFCENGPKITGNEYGTIMTAPSDRKRRIKEAVDAMSSLPSDKEATLALTAVGSSGDQSTCYIRVKHIGALINAGAAVHGTVNHHEVTTLVAEAHSPGAIMLTSNDDFRSFLSVIRWAKAPCDMNTTCRGLLTAVLSGFAGRPISVEVPQTTIDLLTRTDSPIKIHGEIDTTAFRVMLSGLNRKREVGETRLRDQLINSIPERNFSYTPTRQLQYRCERDLWVIPNWGITWAVRAIMHLETAAPYTATDAVVWPQLVLSSIGEECLSDGDYDIHMDYS